MRITKDYSEIAEITGGEVLATPEYLQAQEVEDWGYIVHDSFVLPFYIKKKLFFRYLLFTLGDSGVTTEDRVSYLLRSYRIYQKEFTGRFYSDTTCHSFVQLLSSRFGKLFFWFLRGGLIFG